MDFRESYGADRADMEDEGDREPDDGLKTSVSTRDEMAPSVRRGLFFELRLAM